MSKSFIIILLFCFLSLINSATKKKVDDLFNGLYQGDVYSGYLKTKRDGDELFYIYLPAQKNANTAKIMLWLNGGPGCSSLFGLLGEVGPVTENNFAYKFEANPYSWNNEVNLLAIEQPAGVGFSKASDPDFNWDDDLMGENLLFAIKDFLREFNLMDSEFFVSGESYAGVYIPTLATYILNDQEAEKVNLKGVLIGNGLTDFDTDVERSMAEFGYWHGMISFETRCNEIRREIRNNLDGSDIYGIYRLCPKEEKFAENYPLYHNNKNTYRKTILKRLLQKKSSNDNNNFNDEEEDEISIWPNGCAEDLYFDEFLNNKTTKDKLGHPHFIPKSW